MSPSLMVAKVILNPNSCINQGSYRGDMFPRCHSSGQVCLPRKKQETTPLSPRQTSLTSSFVSPQCVSTTEELINKPSFPQLCLSQLWREVQGSNNWEDLVDPLHPLLRQEIIRYGEFVAACYKAFDLNPNSKRYLTCKYGKNNVLKEVGLENSGYEVTKYIYATPDINLNIPIQDNSNCGRWIGYVAVSTDEEAIRKLGRRDILITFRGTVTNSEWIANLMSSLTPARLDPNNPREQVQVESGFLSLYTSDESDNKFGLGSCREQLLSEVSRLLKKYKGEEISISVAGHSMGSSLAVLLAYDISELGLNRGGPDQDVPVTVYSFAGPRVGNLGFKARCEELGVKVLRIVNVNDPITKLPGVFLNESFGVLGEKFEFPFNWNFSCYAHVGVELVLDFFNVQNPSCVHDLETYISLLKFPEAVEKIQSGDQVDLLNRAKEVLLNNTSQVLDVLPLRDIASNMFNLVQSEKAEFWLNVYILGWMNTLALHIFL